MPLDDAINNNLNIITAKKEILANPESPLSYTRLSEIYRLKRKHEVALRASLASARNNRLCAESATIAGQELMRNEQYDAGLELFENRIRLNPDNGCYPNGLKELKTREEIASWKGDIIITSEMGRGDMIQALRYCKIIPRKNGRSITAVAPLDLHSIFKRTGYFDKTTDRIEISATESTAYIPIFRLIKIARASRLKPITNDAYITADHARHEKWKNKLKRDQPLVGLNWAAQRWEWERNLCDSRHINIEELRQISEIPGIKLCSVQKGEAANEWNNCSFSNKFTSEQPEIDSTNDYDDTLAILMCCDFVVTVDTSVAHLAGAAGLRTWILLKHTPCWRWGIPKVDLQPSGWYKNALVTSQAKPWDWKECIQQIASNIQEIIELRSTGQK